MAILTVSSDVRLNPGFENKIRRDLEKIEDMSPRNTMLRVFLKRSEAGLFETEMETSGFSKKLFSKARASNAFSAFKKCRDILVKQIHKQMGRNRSINSKRARTDKRALYLANELVPDAD